MYNSNFPRNPQQNLYHQKKRQVYQIARRIDKKKSMEIFLERSEGSLLQNQIKSELNRAEKKKIKAKTVNFGSLSRKETHNYRKIVTQTPSRLAKVFQGAQEEAQIPVQNIIMKKNRASKPYAGALRPQLEQLSRFLSQTRPQILEKRRKIIQLLILCLMRRSHKKLYEALDVAIEVSSFFSEEQPEYILKSLCFTLIGKIYQEIQLSLSHNRKKAGRGLRRTGSKLSKKRHSSFMIKTLASQRVFFNRFAHRYKNCKLIRQTSFLKELRFQTSSAVKESLDANSQGISSELVLRRVVNTFDSLPSTPVMSRLNEKVVLDLPHPQKLFGDPQLRNYGIIIHQREVEKNSKLFPYQYASDTLGPLIDKAEYVRLISTVNSVLFKETQCFTLQQVLIRYLCSLMVILLSIVIGIGQLIVFDSPSWIFWLITIVQIVIIAITVLTMLQKQEKQGIADRQQKNKAVKKVLEKWNIKYQQQNIIFKTTQACEAIIVCFPSQEREPQNSQLGMDSINQSFSSSRSSRFAGNHSVSINKQSLVNLQSYQSGSGRIQFCNLEVAKEKSDTLQDVSNLQSMKTVQKASKEPRSIRQLIVADEKDHQDSVNQCLQDHPEELSKSDSDLRAVRSFGNLKLITFDNDSESEQEQT